MNKYLVSGYRRMDYTITIPADSEEQARDLFEHSFSDDLVYDEVESDEIEAMVVTRIPEEESGDE